jgi:hypothetical protein
VVEGGEGKGNFPLKREDVFLLYLQIKSILRDNASLIKN